MSQALSIILLLAGLTWVAPAYALTFTETFDCANNAALDCVLDWTEYSGTDWQILNNDAIVSGVTSSDFARSESATATDQQFVQGVLEFNPDLTNNLGISLACRHHTSATTFYQVQAAANATTLRIILSRVTAGSFVDLVDDTTDPADNDVFRLECTTEGANARLRFYRNGTFLFDYLDTSSVISGNTLIGISAFSDGAGQTGGWKSITYGDIGCAGRLLLLGVGGC